MTKESFQPHFITPSLRYCLNKADADAYVLCDVIGCIGDHQWRAECLRVVGDNEKPLLLQSLWKPKEGYARRFEIQKRASVEEKTSKDKDTVTAGTTCGYETTTNNKENNNNSRQYKQ